MKEQVAQGKFNEVYVKEQKPEETKKSLNSKTRINLFDSPKKLGLVLTFVISITQVLQGAWSAYLNENTNAKIEETKRVHELSQRILESIPSITGEKHTVAKSKVTLGALYVMAQDNKDREDIIRIALLSDEEELRKAVLFIIENDTKATDEIKKLAQRVMTLKARKQIDNKNDEQVQKQLQEERKKNIVLDETDTDAANTDIPFDKPSPEIKASATLTTKINKKGWIYIGKKDKDNNLLEDKTVNVRRVPQIDQKITTTTFVAMRNNSTSINSKVIGVIPKKEEIKILKIYDRTKLRDPLKDVWAVWAEVEINNVKAE